MVKLWPWKSDDTSPASFEKTLSALATKISASQTQLSTLQQRGRRTKALWTLYTSFAYLLCFIILLLVVGWQNWSAYEYTAIAGSPLIIWLIRTGITAYYNFRVDSVTQRLEAQQAERTKTIEKLKAATKYNSTQELLEKYGGAPPKPKPKREPSSSNTPGKNEQKNPQRTSMGPPPPTANIQRSGQMPPAPPSQPSTPQPYRSPLPQFAPSPISAQTSPQAEFAPNAFSNPPQYATQGDIGGEGKHWQNRILDLLMGEDETLAKNRIVLICKECRLVNGQAPPGTTSLGELGKWRCFGCGAVNGEESEAVKVVKELKASIGEAQESNSALQADGKDDVKVAEEDDRTDEVAEEPEGEDNSAEDTIEVSPRKGRSKSTRKKA